MNSLSRKSYITTSTLLFLLLTTIFIWGDAVPFIRSTFGDFLVVMFLYSSLLVLFPKIKSPVAGVIILAVAFTVEFLQMGVIEKFFNTDSLLIEATLGSTFDPHDLFAYFLGVLITVAVDWKLRVGARLK